MIDSILLILGVQHNYYLIAIFISGVIISFILVQFLAILTDLLRKVGGF